MYRPRSPEEQEQAEILAKAHTEEQALRDAEEFAERVHASAPSGAPWDVYERHELDWDRVERNEDLTLYQDTGRVY